jgi:hypothetical protein
MGLLNQSAGDYYSTNSLKTYGDYQFISLDQIIDQFIIAYVGEDNIIPKVKRTTVQFHAMRALQELSFDTLKSVKSIEVEVPPNLSVVLPQDYVNYVKLAWSDSAGIEHIIYPTSKTSNPFPIKQNSDGTYDFDANDDGFLDSPILKHQNTIQKSVDPAFTLVVASTAAIPLTQYATYIQTIDVGGSISTVVDNTSDLEVGMFVFHKFFPYGTKISAITAGTSLSTNGGTITLDTASTNQGVASGLSDLIFSNDLVEISDTYRKLQSHTSSTTTDDYEDETRWYAEGQRYGIDPQHAQDNGSYFIDNIQGRVFFNSTLSGKTLVLKYISDGLGTDAEMQVHKFAEEAMYKCIAYAIMSTRANVQEYIVRRFQKDKFAATRKAKLRLSNLKIEELTQILRGKSKQIKH